MGKTTAETRGPVSMHFFSMGACAIHKQCQAESVYENVYFILGEGFDNP